MAENHKILQNSFDTETDVLIFFSEKNPTLQGKKGIQEDRDMKTSSRKGAVTDCKRTDTGQRI